jgi:hypothetical protein
MSGQIAETTAQPARYQNGGGQTLASFSRTSEDAAFNK